MAGVRSTGASAMRSLQRASTRPSECCCLANLLCAAQTLTAGAAAAAVDAARKIAAIGDKAVEAAAGRCFTPHLSQTAATELGFSSELCLTASCSRLRLRFGPRIDRSA